MHLQKYIWCTQSIFDCLRGGVIDEAGRGHGPSHCKCKVQLNWSGQLGVMAPSDMVLRLQRGGNSLSEMGATCPVQFSWGGRLGVMAPSEMVLRLRRGGNSPSEMAARQPGEQAVPEAVPEAAGQWHGQRCCQVSQWRGVGSCQVWKKGRQEWDVKRRWRGHRWILRRDWGRMSWASDRMQEKLA